MNINRILIVGVGLIFGLFVLLQGLTSGGNALSESFKYMVIGGLIFSFFRPREGFWLLIFSLGYLDLLKRFLIFGDYVSLFDVTIILAFSPILCIAIFSSLLVTDLLQREMTPTRVRSLLLLFVLSIFFGGLTVVTDSGLGLLRSLANYCGYIPFVYIVPRLFGTSDEIIKFCKKLTLIFVPVGLYTFKQYILGYTWWELSYLASGLTTEGRILTGQTYRYFSTLNSSQTLAKVGGMLFVFSLFLPWGRGAKKSSLAIGSIFSLIFFLAAIFSGARTGIVMGLVSLFCCIFFRYKTLTIVCYFLGLCLFLSMVLFSEYMLEHETLHKASVWLQNALPFIGEDQAKLLKLGTFTVRLEGFSNWLDPGFWHPFGMSERERSLIVIHDFFSRIIIRVGYIPVSLLGVGGIVMMSKAHQRIWKGGKGGHLVLLGFSLIVGILVGGLSATENLSSFPVNAFLYIFGGMIFVGFNEPVKEPDTVIDTDVKVIDDTEYGANDESLVTTI